MSERRLRGVPNARLSGRGGNGRPNLDQAKPSCALVLDRVTYAKGAMPTFSAQLSPEQIQDVAAFVSSTAGS